MNTVLIVGRMNVGKSTLFNRLARNTKSITLDFEGVTRDFIKDKVSWKNKTFELIDTAGVTLRKQKDKLLETIREKALNLIEKADIILFMVDGNTGLLPEDIEISKFLYKSSKKVILVINKVDNLKISQNLYEFEKLGFKNLIDISAQHGLNINSLLDKIVDLLPQETEKEESDNITYKTVLLGRPNSGKSSLMNLILKQERSIVSEIAGTTREAISENIKFYKQNIELTDTPGIRKPKAIKGELEPLMIKSAFHALKDSDIVVLLIDGSDSNLVDQELKLAFYAYSDQYKALILLINKEDLITDLNRQELERNFDYYKHLIKNIPVLNISCKSGKNIGKILPLVQKVWENYSQKFDNNKLTILFTKNLQKKPLYHTGQKLILYGAKQVNTAPITILLLVNEPNWFGQSQLGFFENLMRSEYDLLGVPVKFIVKKDLD